MNGRAVLAFAVCCAATLWLVGPWCANSEAAVFIQWQDTTPGAASGTAMRARRGAAAASRPNRQNSEQSQNLQVAPRARMHGEARFSPELAMRRRGSVASQVGLDQFDRQGSAELFVGSASGVAAFRRMGVGWDGPAPAGAGDVSDLEAALGRPTLALDLVNRMRPGGAAISKGTPPPWSDLLASESRAVGGPLGSGAMFGPVGGQRAGGAASTGLLAMARSPGLEPFDGWSNRPLADNDLASTAATRRDAEPVAFAIWCAIGAVGAGAYYRLR